MGDVANQGMQQGAFDLTQFYTVFFEEAAENLAGMESLLVEIDVAQPSDDDLDAVFRVAHSIKGGAATFGFADVTVLTHELETLLDRLRRHELTLDRTMIDVLLEAGDVVRAQLARHQGRSEHVPPSDELIARIQRLAAPAGRAPAPASEVAAASSESRALAPAPGRVADSSKDSVDNERHLLVRVGPGVDPALGKMLADLFQDIPDLGTIIPADGGEADADGYRRFLVYTAASDSELIELFSFHVAREQVLIQTRPALRQDAEFGIFDDAPGAPRSRVPVAAASPAAAPTAALPSPTLRSSTPPSSTVSIPTAPASAGAPEAASTPAKARTERALAGSGDANTLRVAVERVDQLINLVGELVINQAMLTQQVKDLDPDLDPARHRALLGGVSDLERNTRHLQEAVMSIRMIPMSFVFNRFPRMIRDLAAKLDKRIELRMVGEATELDKGLIEKIVDPLTHLVRNSADHGIETAERRRAAGKPETGTITLSAAHQGGSIVIEVRDDGQGLRRDRILAKARERGLPVRDDLSDPEVWALIWEAGFSTADAVSDVSGRGVGMDVVRRNIAALGGSAEIHSAPGQGTRVSVRLPLTLAIMDGMSISVGDETYILPLASVLESFQVEHGMIQTVGSNGRVVRLRDEFMPVVTLAEEFRVPRTRADQGRDTGPPILVVVQAEGRRLAVIVDELLGQHQVVVKNLESNYRRVRDISGATILGDGRVALIIDVAGLVKRARH
jgi:two-component system chemotaxis sensor kinase CheA